MPVALCLRVFYVPPSVRIFLSSALFVPILRRPIPTKLFPYVESRRRHECDITLFIFLSAPYAAIPSRERGREWLEGGGGGGDIPDMRQMRSFCVSPICLPYYVPASSPVRVRPAIRVQTSAPLSLTRSAENCRLICCLKTFSRRLI